MKTFVSVATGSGLWLFRSENLQSRTTRWVTVKAGSAQRRYICVACRTRVATESSQWPQTKHTYSAVSRHEKSCSLIVAYNRRAASLADVRDESI
jgi:hypothetical protein